MGGSVGSMLSFVIRNYQQQKHDNGLLVAPVLRRLGDTARLILDILISG